MMSYNYDVHSLFTDMLIQQVKVGVVQFPRYTYIVHVISEHTPAIYMYLPTWVVGGFN